MKRFIPVLFVLFSAILFLSFHPQLVLTDEKPVVVVSKVPDWLHPCTVNTGYTYIKHHIPYAATRKEEFNMYNTILNYIDDTNRKMKSWVNEWVKEVLNDDYQTRLENWKAGGVEEVQSEVLNFPSFIFSSFERKKINPASKNIPNLDKDRFQIFQDTRNNFQKVAVFLSLIYDEEYNKNDKYSMNFFDFYQDLHLILCEIDSTMYSVGEGKTDDQSPELLPDSIANGSANVKNNLVFAVIQVFLDSLEFARPRYDYLTELARFYSNVIKELDE